jgi:hypothetical protein
MSQFRANKDNLHPEINDSTWDTVMSQFRVNMDNLHPRNKWVSMGNSSESSQPHKIIQSQHHREVNQHFNY